MSPKTTPIFKADEQKSLPVWVQLRNRIVYLIRTGSYAPGERLPSVRSLAAESAVNYNTVSKAYVNLEQEGYVRSVHGRGVFVAEQLPPSDGEGDLRVVAETILRDALGRCMALGMPREEAVALACDLLESEGAWPGGPPGDAPA